MSLIGGPDPLGSIDDEATWEAHDARDQDLRRARWLAVVTGWVLGQDEMVTKLIAPMTLAELIDLDASLTSLRYEIRQIVAKLDAPWTKQPRG
jgi:hypothetical protein